MLLVDLGNTRGKFRRSLQDHLLDAVYWDYQASPDPILAPYASDVLVMASVSVPERANLLRHVALQLGMSICNVTTESQRFGVTNGYVNPQQLGVDRWLALIGVRQLDPKDCLVIDAGTAVTIDAMDREGQHRGGWILPGSQLMSKALTTGTPLALSQECGLLNFAKETSQGIANGVLAGIIGAIQQAILEATHVFGQSPQIWLTGGAASMLSPWIAYPHQVHADLVFLGLQQYGRLTCNR